MDGKDVDKKEKEQEEQTIFQGVRLMPEMIEKIDKYKKTMNFVNRSEALRSVIAIGLKSIEKEVQLEGGLK